MVFGQTSSGSHGSVTSRTGVLCAAQKNKQRRSAESRLKVDAGRLWKSHNTPRQKQEDAALPRRRVAIDALISCCASTLTYRTHL